MWKKKSNFKRFETKIAIWNIVLNFLSIMIGVSFGLWQFNKQQENSRRLEYRKSVWQMELDTYVDLSKSVGLIITSINSSENLRLERSKFEELYWGKLALIENEKTDAALINNIRLFKSALNTYTFDNEDEIDNTVKLGYNIIQECKKLTTENLKKLENEK